MISRPPELSLRYPALLVHGLFSRSRTWRKTVNAFQEDYDLRFGGEVSAATDVNDQQIAPADFYTWNFSNHHKLSYAEQASELLKGIELIKTINRTDKVILIGHSMGGLAGRAVIQIKKSGSVYALITLGTPHYGSPLALLRESTRLGALQLLRRLQKMMLKADYKVEKTKGFMNALRRKLFRIATETESETNEFFNSEAFIELAPGSAALEELNTLPLPQNIHYVFITGSLTGFSAFQTDLKEYKKLTKWWLSISSRAVHKITSGYLAESYATFKAYLARYYKEAQQITTDQLYDFDGAVPVFSQAIRHFEKTPEINVILPVFSSHIRLTRKPVKIYQALAICGAIGRRQSPGVAV